jgi:hypothetical protein
MQEQDFNEDDVQDQEQQHRDPVRSHMRKLEAENKELRQLKAEAEEAKKKIAFVEAGIDLASPISKYFIKAYDGDMSADAIRAAAAEANLTQPKAARSNGPARTASVEPNGKCRKSLETSQNRWLTTPQGWLNAKSESEVMELLAQARANQSNII